MADKSRAAGVKTACDKHRHFSDGPTCELCDAGAPAFALPKAEEAALRARAPWQTTRTAPHSCSDAMALLRLLDAARALLDAERAKNEALTIQLLVRGGISDVLRVLALAMQGRFHELRAENERLRAENMRMRIERDTIAEMLIEEAGEILVESDTFVESVRKLLDARPAAIPAEVRTVIEALLPRITEGNARVLSSWLAEPTAAGKLVPFSPTILPTDPAYEEEIDRMLSEKILGTRRARGVPDLRRQILTREDLEASEPAEEPEAPEVHGADDGREREPGDGVDDVP